MKNLFYLLFLAFAFSSSSLTAQLCQGINPEVECDDGDPCTLDICQFGFCQNIPIEPGAPCDDGFEESFDDVYDENCNCVGTCNDDDPNTTDLYIDGIGCIFIPIPEGLTVCDTTACSDFAADLANPCSQSFFINVDGILYCQRIRFNGTLGDIDNNICTEHECDCGEVIEIGTICEPQEPDPCHEYICDPNTGECLQVAVNCDDFNPATYDFCHPEFGCQHVTIPEGRTACEVIDCESPEAQLAHGLCSVTHILPDGSCVTLLLSGSFDDGDACTLTSSCLCGTLYGQNIDCDDNNNCTLDGCDPVTGECTHTLYWSAQLENLPLPTCYELCGYRVLDSNGNVLEDALDPLNCVADSIGLQSHQIFDGNFDDVVLCEYVLELHYVLINCDDGDPCTIDFCDLETGGCAHLPIIINSPCDDGDACTINDAYNDQCDCIGEPVSCDDGDPCTTDSCDSETGECVHIPVDCCDDNPYTIDSCVDGQCGHVNDWLSVVNNLPIGPCAVLCSWEVKDQNGNSLDQESFNNPECELPGFEAAPITQLVYDPCTQLYHSYTISYNFQPKNCDDADPCTIDTCDPETGNCVHTPIDCDDSNIYTIDSCINGQCEHEEIWELEVLSIDADNACFYVCNYQILDSTNDLFIGWFGDYTDCDGPSGSIDVELDDENGNPLDITIFYTLKAVDCDDGDPCTEDDCNPITGCTHTPIIPGTACDDGNPCTENDLYDAECSCVGTPKDCDDGNPCTVDSCDPLTGNCLHIIQECDDNDPCTLDGCNPETGECEHLPVWNYTIENTTPPFCHELCGYIVTDSEGNILDDSNSPVDCDADVIIPVAGEFSEFFLQESPCSYIVQFHYRLTHEACDDGDPCTVDTCDPVTGNCSHVPKDCDDLNSYTLDSCDGETGTCVHVFVWQEALDNLLINNPCFTICNYLVTDATNDILLGWFGEGTDCGEADQQLVVDTIDDFGNAVQLIILYSTTAVNCDDGDPCTIDSCDDFAGCQHFPVFPGTECDDGDPNTVNDVYLNTPDCECAGVPIIPGCVQEDACNFDPTVNTDDGSCIFPGEPCDDGDPLTINDVLDEECDCVGVPLILGCPNIDACNYDPLADTDDGSCLYPGEPCDDGDPDTIDDTYNTFCSCVGMPICKEDLTGDGVIDTLDLLQFLGAFGTQCDD